MPRRNSNGRTRPVCDYGNPAAERASANSRPARRKNKHKRTPGSRYGTGKGPSR